MTGEASVPSADVPRQSSRRATERFGNEDWWAVWISLAIVAGAILLFKNGSSINAAGNRRARVGLRLAHFVPSFAMVFVLTIPIFALGLWDQAARYSLEPPVVALVVGLIISNVGRLPAWTDAGFRGEYYIKIGIVLLGATLPLTLIL